MSKLNQILSLSVLLILTSCGKSSDNSKTAVANAQKQIGDLLKTKPVNFLGRAGQPGEIKLSGVIVNEQNLIDSRISVEVRGGLKNATEREDIKEDNLPILSVDASAVDLKSAYEDDSLLALGCDQAQAEDLAKEKNLKLRGLKDQTVKTFISDAARVVVICGDASSILTTAFVTIDADELILDNMSLVKDDAVGFVKLKANTLTLKGQSSIETKAKADDTTGLVSSIEIAVVKQLNGEAGKDQLSVTSTGKDSSQVSTQVSNR